jgi:hypothetical protein
MRQTIIMPVVEWFECLRDGSRDGSASLASSLSRRVIPSSVVQWSCALFTGLVCKRWCVYIRYIPINGYCSWIMTLSRLTQCTSAGDRTEPSLWPTIFHFNSHFVGICCFSFSWIFFLFCFHRTGGFGVLYAPKMSLSALSMHAMPTQPFFHTNY